MGKYKVNCTFGPDTEVGGSAVYRMTLGRSDVALHDFSPSFNATERDAMVSEASGSMQDFVDSMPSGVATWFNNQALPMQTALKASSAAY